MSNKYKKVIKIIVVICIIILIVDILYLFYKKRPIYFDSINSFEVIPNGYVAVGSNNKNKGNYEKAKITKYNHKKEKVWEKLYNNKYNSSYFGIEKDDKYYVAVGDYEANKDERKDNVRTALIVKYDDNGNIVNENSLQILGDSKFTNLLVVSDGYIVVGQSIYENMTLGLSDQGGAIIIKYDKNLKEIWRSNYGGSKSGIYNDLVMVNNNIYAVGKDAKNTGIISKYNKMGERIATTNYSYTDRFGFTGIVDINDELYVVGAKKTNENNSDYHMDCLIVKYDLECKKVKEQKNKIKDIGRFNKIIRDDESIIIAGQRGIKHDDNFLYSGIFAIYDKDLNKLLLKYYNVEKDNYFTDIKRQDDTYIISGYGTSFKDDYQSKFIIYKTPKRRNSDK